mgnify:CR=1 FL=1
MSDLETKYTKDHEVVKVEHGDVAVIGITEYAQHALGDLVFVDLPEVGQNVEKGEDFAAVESVKVTAEVYTPVTGEVVAINEDLADDLDLITESFEKGWIAKVKMDNPDELSELMDEAAYKQFCEEQDD